MVRKASTSNSEEKGLIIGAVIGGVILIVIIVMVVGVILFLRGRNTPQGKRVKGSNVSQELEVNIQVMILKIVLQYRATDELSQDKVKFVELEHIQNAFRIHCINIDIFVASNTKLVVRRWIECNL